MKNKVMLIFRVVLLGLLCLFWFIFIQVEYEIITKPYLLDDFPDLKRMGGAYLFGIVVLVASLLIIYLIYPALRRLKVIKKSLR